MQCPYERRVEIWDALAAVVEPDKLDAMTSEVALADVADLAGAILAGQVKGRTVVRCSS